MNCAWLHCARNAPPLLLRLALQHNIASRWAPPHIGHGRRACGFLPAVCAMPTSAPGCAPPLTCASLHAHTLLRGANAYATTRTTTPRLRARTQPLVVSVYHAASIFFHIAPSAFSPAVAVAAGMHCEIRLARVTFRTIDASTRRRIEQPTCGAGRDRAISTKAGSATFCAALTRGMRSTVIKHLRRTYRTMDGNSTVGGTHAHVRRRCAHHAAVNIQCSGMRLCLLRRAVLFTVPRTAYSSIPSPYASSRDTGFTKPSVACLQNIQICAAPRLA